MTPGGELERLRHNFFYRDGTPELARSMLQSFVCEELPALMTAAASGEAEQRSQVSELLPRRILFFARAAQGRPEILRAYEAVARAVPVERVGMVLKLLVHAGDEATATFLRGFAAEPANSSVAGFIAEALKKGLGPAPEIEQTAATPIKDASHLDLRWVDFMATGSTCRIAEIVGVLAWPDRLRAHVQPLVAQRKGLAALLGGNTRARATAARLEPLGFRFDPVTRELLNRDDVDLRAILREGRPDGARFKSFVDALPTRPPNDVAVAAAIKATAMASLISNAVEHPRVLAAIEAAAGGLTGAVRLALLELLGFAYERRGEFAAAEASWSICRELDPERGEIGERLEAIALERRFAALREAPATAGELPQGAGEALARRCAEQLERTAAYHTRARYELRCEPLDDDQPVSIEWRASQSGRERIRVFRAFSSRHEQGLADEWIDVGGDNYMRGPGMWIKTPPGFTSRAQDDELLRTDRFAALLRGTPPERCAGSADGAVIELAWDSAEIGELVPLRVPAQPLRVRLWIDRSTAWLMRAAVSGSDREFELVCCFVAPERPPSIEAPVGALDMSKATPTRTGG